MHGFFRFLRLVDRAAHRDNDDIVTADESGHAGGVEHVAFNRLQIFMPCFDSGGIARHRGNTMPTAKRFVNHAAADTTGGAVNDELQLFRAGDRCDRNQSRQGQRKRYQR